MRGSSFPKAAARKARTSASTPAGSARTPATSPATTPNEQPPTTSPGCATATTASRGAGPAPLKTPGEVTLRRHPDAAADAARSPEDGHASGTGNTVPGASSGPG